MEYEFKIWHNKRWCTARYRFHEWEADDADLARELNMHLRWRFQWPADAGRAPSPVDLLNHYRAHYWIEYAGARENGALNA